MKILIIGGTGFIGSNIAHKLSENTANYNNRDNLFRGKLDSSIIPETRKCAFSNAISRAE